jgi:hypothetical protein
MTPSTIAEISDTEIAYTKGMDVRENAETRTGDPELVRLHIAGVRAIERQTWDAIDAALEDAKLNIAMDTHTLERAAAEYFSGKEQAAANAYFADKDEKARSIDAAQQETVGA